MKLVMARGKQARVRHAIRRCRKRDTTAARTDNFTELMKLSDDLACAKWLTAKRGNAGSRAKTRARAQGGDVL